MDAESMSLNVVHPDQLHAAGAGEIDAVIAHMLEESRSNYAQIEALALECSSALTSAEAKSNGLSEQGLFKRLWNSVTGKNERLRTAIEQDRAAAQYAMQQAINSVLRECTQNRILALAVKNTLEGKLSDHEIAEALSTVESAAEHGSADALDSIIERLYTEEELSGAALTGDVPDAPMEP